jgi:hypothetical protein
MDKDIILTTYETLRSEWSDARSNSVLYHHPSGWARIVLDEGIYPLMRQKWFGQFSDQCQNSASHPESFDEDLSSDMRPSR